MNMMENNLLAFNTEKKNNQDTLIKVIGVGGGGGNAVNYMYSQQVKNVSYLLCNTDRQHLNRCDVPDTICLGETITKGLGAGNNPEKARAAAEESREEICQALSDGTEMVFITAGMGGGTGTGAAPVIAGLAKEMGILTVGVVTIPFLFEGRMKILKAIEGVEKLKKNVDAILVVKNELLNHAYPNMKITDAFRKADEILCNSTRSISEMVTIDAVINVDMADVRTTLQDGGVSIITWGFASQQEGISVAFERALNSPLLNTSNFEYATRILYQIIHRPNCEPGTDLTEKLNVINARIKKDYEFIWGMGERPEDQMEDEIGFILLASGFSDQEEVMGLGEYKNKAQAEVLEEERSKRSAEDEVIKGYYPEYSTSAGVGAYETVLFSDELLNNNEFITLVNSTPTLIRKDVEKERIKQYAETLVQSVSLTYHYGTDKHGIAQPNKGPEKVVEKPVDEDVFTIPFGD